ncbi:MAG: hypothetical protein M3N28_06150 [Actinomycetota bacterium]|nr:hypothetical protein [Actinomycetota bacterium]
MKLPPVGVGRLAALVLVLLGACSSGGPDRSASGGAPPRTREALVREFGAEVERLGLRITRAGLVERLGASGYDEDGRHLAVYVEPTGPLDIGGYVANVDRLAKVFLPKAFNRLAQIDSFDVCQEPPPGVDDREQPTVMTQLLVNRSQAQAIDWQAIRLEHMLAASFREPEAIKVGVATQVRASPAWKQAFTEAQLALRPRGP